MDKCKEAFIRQFGPRTFDNEEEILPEVWDKYYRIFSAGWAQAVISHQEATLKLFEATFEVFKLIGEKKDV